MILFSRSRCCEARVFEQFFPTHERYKLYPATVSHIRYAQGEIAVRDRNRLVADFYADKAFVKLADHESKQRFLHRHYDSLSFAAAPARVQRGENTAYHADAGRFVADADRFGSRRAAIIPPGMGPAGHAVVGVRRAAVVFIRSCFAKPARAGVN